MQTRKILLQILFLTLLFSYGVVKNDLDILMRHRDAEEFRLLPSPQLASVLSFGYREAMADVYWIAGINYFGEQLSSPKRNYKYLKSYVDLILKLDPLFVEFYNWASTAFVYNGLRSITRESVANAIRYGNYGIENLYEKFRLNRDIIVKTGFNYAAETENRIVSVPYFKLAALGTPDGENFLPVAAAYARAGGSSALSADLQLEYFGKIAFLATSADELTYSLQLLSSPKMNSYAFDFIKALRLRMEADSEIKKVVESKVAQKDLFDREHDNPNPLPADPRLENILNLDIARTWLAPEMLALLSL